MWLLDKVHAWEARKSASVLHSFLDQHGALVRIVEAKLTLRTLVTVSAFRHRRRGG